MTKKKETSYDYAITLILIPVTFIGYAILTSVSWLLAFANDEGTVNETIGAIGYYGFNVFRFPTHNLFWDKQEFVMDNYFVLLFVNVLLYSLLTTIGITLWIRKNEKG